jgi:hypothetical protein
MMADYWQRLKTETLDAATAFGRDVGHVFQALGFWGVIFLGVQIILGVLPLLFVLTLGSTVDAMIGARGIGVVTGDVNQQLSRWLILLIITFVAYLFSVRFTGKAGEVGRGLRNVVIFGCLLGYFVTINQIFLGFIFLLALVVDLVWSRVMGLRMANLFVVILVGSSVAHTLIRYTVLRSFTVGEGLTMVAAIAMFVVFLKLRIAYAPHS